MNVTANLRPRIRSNRATHIRRKLVGNGKISVVVNQEISSSDILGQSARNAGFFSVKIAKLLGVDPEEGAKYLQRPIGSKIYKGELLGLKSSLFGKKFVTAPTDGILDFYDPDKGELRLKSLPKVIPLTSGVYGIVDAVNHQTGEILIKAMVTEITGVLGIGGERGGVLSIINNSSGLLSQRQITADMSNHIIVAGSLILSEGLKKAVECGVYGIITGGLNARDYKAMSGNLDPSQKMGADPGISIVATEGFGSLPIGDDIVKVVSKSNGKYVFLSGNSARLLLPSTDPDSIMALRKVILPQRNEVEGSLDLSLGEIKVGNRVRIIWAPFAGFQGKVVGIDKTLSVLPSGISTYLLTVETKLRKIRVPYPNVELIND
jgi:hypothetical protein